MAGASGEPPRSASAEADAWPTWATATVEVVAPDPGWAHLAERLAADLNRRCAPWLDGEVEHIGSTAIPGLPAKPIVDLMAPVTRLAETPEADRRLMDGGWELVPPKLDGRPWRRFYVLPEGDHRSAHLHLVERGHPRWREVVAFRDALLADASLAARYAAIKREAADRFGDDREAYTRAKSAFVQRVVQGGT